MALDRIKDPNKLNIRNQAQLEKKLLAAIKDFKPGFAVEKKRFGKKERVDLDASSSLSLFARAGMNVDKVELIPSGGYKQGYINLDTGNKEGFVVVYEGMEKGEPYTGQPLTVYFDHHAADSKRGSSSTKYVYRVLEKLKLLDKNDRVLKQAVEYVTQEDNRSYPNEEKYYKDSAYTLLGLGRYISFDKLYQFFKDGLKPTQRLTEQQLEEYGLTKAHKIQQRVLGRTEPTYKQLEKDGFVVQSRRYGKILIDINGEFSKKAGGFVGAKAMGAETYIIWSPGTRSFMVSTAKEDGFPEKLLPQGRRLRETMWIKEGVGPIKLRLNEVIKTMAGRDFRMGQKMRAALEKAEAEAKERRAKARERVNAAA